MSTQSMTSTFSPTSSVLTIEVYGKTVSPKPIFQKNIPSSSPGIAEIVIILIVVGSFIACILCNIALVKSKRQLRRDAVVQELRLREEAASRSIIQYNPLYQV